VSTDNAFLLRESAYLFRLLVMRLGSARLHNFCSRLFFPFSPHFPPKHNSTSTPEKDHPHPTTMAAKDIPTTEIPLRAAKGVSRFFLFDALRTGCDEIDTSSSQLGSARDKAEKILAQESPVEFESLIRDVSFVSLLFQYDQTVC
jgi:hypothetical protein